MPLLHVGCNQVRIYRKQEWRVGIHQGIGWEPIRQHGKSRDTAIDGVGVGRSGAALSIKGLNREEWRIEAHARIGPGTRFVSSIEYSVARANHQFLGHLVSQAEARREIIKVRLD